MPDFDNVNKLCKEFKVDINQLIEGIYENKNQSIKSNRKITIKKIVIAIIIVYLLAILPKAILFLRILHKNNMENINSYGYTYNQTISFEDTEIRSLSRIAEHQIDSFGITDDYSSEVERWIANENEYYVYAKVTELESNTVEEYYSTEEFSVDTTPFEYVNLFKDKFGILQILNPFKFYKISNGEMIVSLSDEGSILCIDIKTGYVSKIKFIFENGYTEYVYMGIQVNNIENSQVEIEESTK